MFSDRDHRASAQPDPGDARCAVRSHREQKGGGRRRERRCRQLGHGRQRLRRLDQGGRLRLGHSEALGQLGQGTGGGIPQRPQRRPQDDQEDVDPLMGLALAHPKEPPLHHLQRIGLHIDQEKQQPILRCGQGTVLVGRVPSGGARLPIEAPVGHMRLKRGLKGRDQALKLTQRKAGQIEHLYRAALEIDESSRSHGGGLLSLEAQDIINRDELY